MSKSKKERQQEKKELRQAQEKAQPKQPQAEKKPEPKPVEAKNAQPVNLCLPGRSQKGQKDMKSTVGQERQVLM